MNAHEFLKYKNWAVAGDVLNETKYAHKIMSRLKFCGFNVTGINPRSMDKEVYKSLKDVPGRIEVLDLCINALSGIEIVKEAFEMGINMILIQPGAESSDILEYCREKKMDAVQGCALVELTGYHKEE